MITPRPSSSLVIEHRRPALLAGFFGALALFMSLHVAFGSAPASATVTASSTPIPFITTSTGGASNGESTCVDGTNCDTFTLTVGGAVSDYVGKIVKFNFSWTLPVSDYDFYIHKGTLTGAIVATGANDGAPATTDQAANDPGKDGVGVYIVHIVYFSAAAADQCRGVVSIAAANVAQRTATYPATSIAFSPNMPLKAPVTARDGEPSSRTDFMGNTYVCGIRGFPAGVDLWYFDLNSTRATYDPQMRVPIYRGQPDAFGSNGVDAGGDGGGDIDLAVSFSLAPTRANPTLAFASLIAANISTGNSFDRAQTYSRNGAGNVTGGIPADDRQWEEFLANTSVYLLYRTLAPAVTQIQRSNDGGFTFGAAQTAGAIGQVGPIDVHQATGTVYAPGSTGVIGVGTPATASGEPLSTDYKVRTAADDPNGVAHLFFVTKVADDGTANGTLYACYSNDKDVFLKSSADKGVTWTDPVKVNSPAIGTKINLFPWMETGPTKGSVGVVWFGTSNATNDDNAEWKVYFAQSFNADAASPAFSVAEVTEPNHFIHGANISEGGLTGTANRNLIDYFQVSFDPQGAAVVAYTDDHNDFDGHTYVSHQIGGPSIRGGTLPTPVEGASLVLPASTTSIPSTDAFPPRQPGLNGEQVTDFALDVQNALLTRVRVVDPLDIVSVRYDTSGTGASLAIGTTIRVSDMSTIPPNSSWRANFTVNAPHSVISATGTYSYGVSDHGDQFFLRADTDASGFPTYSYGKAVRNSDGTLTYATIGAADNGSISQAGGTINIQVSAAKLNAALATGRTAIANGTIVSGLRSQSFTSQSGNGRRDLTRGGTQFVVYDSAFPAPVATPSPSPLPNPAVAPTGPTPAPVLLANISSRVSVKTGDQIAIGGFVVRGQTGSKPKRVLILGRGPSLTGLPSLTDPTLDLFNSSNTVIASNDNWRGPQQAEITASGLAPKFDQEAAIVAALSPGTYTAQLKGVNSGRGIGIIEVFDLDYGSLSDLGNISTRGFVDTGDGLLIAGLIITDNTSRSGQQKILVRSLGPSLAAAPFNLVGTLPDPTITLVDANGTPIDFNDNWRTNQTAIQAQAPTLAPTKDEESALIKTLSPGLYTVLVQGKGTATGIATAEVFNLGAP